MTPDFPSPTQLDYKYFSSSDHNSTKICSCLWCTSCTSPVLLTAGLCQHSSWKGLHTAEVYPCCPSNTTTQPSHQELGPALIPCRAAAADCWFTQLPQAEPSPWGHPSKGADTRRQLRQRTLTGTHSEICVLTSSPDPYIHYHRPRHPLATGWHSCFFPTLPWASAMICFLF